MHVGHKFQILAIFNFRKRVERNAHLVANSVHIEYYKRRLFVNELAFKICNHKRLKNECSLRGFGQGNKGRHCNSYFSRKQKGGDSIYESPPAFRRIKCQSTSDSHSDCLMFNYNLPFPCFAALFSNR